MLRNPDLPMVTVAAVRQLRLNYLFVPLVYVASAHTTQQSPPSPTGMRVAVTGEESLHCRCLVLRRYSASRSSCVERATSEWLACQGASPQPQPTGGTGGRTTKALSWGCAGAVRLHSACLLAQGQMRRIRSIALR